MVGSGLRDLWNSLGSRRTGNDDLAWEADSADIDICQPQYGSRVLRCLFNNLAAACLWAYQAVDTDRTHQFGFEAGEPSEAVVRPTNFSYDNDVCLSSGDIHDQFESRSESLLAQFCRRGY